VSERVDSTIKTKEMQKYKVFRYILYSGIKTAATFKKKLKEIYV